MHRQERRLHIKQTKRRWSKQFFTEVNQECCILKTCPSSLISNFLLKYDYSQHISHYCRFSSSSSSARARLTLATNDAPRVVQMGKNPYAYDPKGQSVSQSVSQSETHKERGIQPAATGPQIITTARIGKLGDRNVRGQINLILG
jgi:hypothetical protein